jgi:hypothetical protein
VSDIITEQPSGEIGRDSDGKKSATRMFIVYSDSGSLDFEDVISNTGLPQIGQPHPSDNSIIVGSYAIRANPDRKDTYDVTYTYKTPDEVVGDDDEDEEIEEVEVIDGAEAGSAVVAFTMNVGLSIVDIWKAAPTIPADINDPARVDIGGTLVSEGGYPISLAIPIVEIGINQLFSGFFNAGTFLNKVAKRNNAEWQGFPAGSVLFTGVDVTQDTEGENTATFKCSYDTFYHLRQVPQRDEDGNPKVTWVGDDPPVPSMNVYFKQPFKDTTDFGFLPF